MRGTGQERSERGQSTVEFALVFPFLLLMLFAVLFFANYALVAVDISAAADQGAQWAAEHAQQVQDPGTWANQVQQVTVNMSPWPTLQNSDVSVALGPVYNQGGGAQQAPLLKLAAGLNLGSLLGANLCVTLLGQNTCSIPVGTKVIVTVQYPISRLYILGPEMQALINGLDRIVGGSGVTLPQYITSSAEYLAQ